MWYVLRCHSGQEQRIMDSCKRNMPEKILKEAFTFTCDRMKRYQGQWHMEAVQMFPNYVFLESDYDKELSGELKQYRDIVQVLEDKDILLNVYPEEEEFLRYLCGHNHHLNMSRGYIRDGVAYVSEGPLKGMENRIRKIDRHRRVARVEAPIRHAAKGGILAGLEIVEKS